MVTQFLNQTKKIASKKKPYILATGASSIVDVTRAVKTGLKINKDMALLQCNTNYTASLENFKYINLKVLEQYKNKFPNLILGLSDHTPGHATVLGSVALGGRIVEKHFTDDNNRDGPDHLFSMNPETWKEMVDRTRELEESLGKKIKKVEKNETETVILQRRAVRAKSIIKKNEKFSLKNLICLRPSPKNAVQPYELKKLLNKRAKKLINAGDIIKWENTK